MFFSAKEYPVKSLNYRFLAKNLMRVVNAKSEVDAAFLCGCAVGWATANAGRDFSLEEVDRYLDLLYIIRKAKHEEFLKTY